MLAMKTKNATKPGNVTASRTLDAGLSSPSHPPVVRLSVRRLARSSARAGAKSISTGSLVLARAAQSA